MKVGKELILVFALVFVFLWGYLKFFPRPHKLKMILVVTVFIVLISCLVSFLTVYGVHGAYDTGDLELVRARRNPVLARVSLPFYLEAEYGWMEAMINTGDVWFRIFFAKVQLLEMEFEYIRLGESFIFPQRQINVNYTTTLFYQLFLILTALNMLGAPLAAFTYKLTEKIAKKIL